MATHNIILLMSSDRNCHQLVRKLFQGQFTVLITYDESQLLEILSQKSRLVAAAMLHAEDASALLPKVKALTEPEEVPILQVYADLSPEAELAALAQGVSEVLNLSEAPAILLRHALNVIELYRYKRQLKLAQQEHEQSLRRSNQVIMDTLTSVIEHRSAESGQHVLRIRRFTKILLQDIASHYPEYQLTPDQITMISSAAALHDIGKISIPDTILNKPGKLTAEEYEVIKGHCMAGFQMLEHLHGIGTEEYLSYAYDICRHHHERWDGSGYPDRLTGTEIPISAQVVGLSDAYDALTSERVYKAPVPCDQAVDMILNGECGAFSPKLMLSLIRVKDQFEELAHYYADGNSPKGDDLDMPLPGQAGSDLHHRY